MSQRIFSSAARIFGSIGVMLLVHSGVALAQQMPMMQLGMMPMQATESDLIHKLLPSVVTVNVSKDATQAEPGMNASGKGAGEERVFGSGFVVDPSGVIATNAHVVLGAWHIEVTFADGTKVPARILNIARLIDVALVKVDVDHALPALRWGDSDELHVGVPVFAIGNALGVGISVSGGIVSGLNRDIMDSPYDDYIQTDAAINHGNSGGPLFNTKGEVIGIDTAIISYTTAWSGVGFAIPSHSAQIVINHLLNPNAPRPGWIGVQVQLLTSDMAQALGMKKAGGSIVSALAPGGPAAEAGLHVGDIIEHLEFAPPTDQRALLRTIATTPIGQMITFVLWRDGQEENLTVPVKEWPLDRWTALERPTVTPQHHNIPPDLGLALAPIDDANRANSDLDMNQTGILITGVVANTDAADRGLAAGDVILRVQERTVSTVADVEAALASAKAENRKYILMLVKPKVQQKIGPEWVALRVTND